jgi:hypothetical protein
LNSFIISNEPSTSELTGHLISISTGLPSPLTKNFPTSHRPSSLNKNSPLSCLPIWVAKKIEVVGPDFSDVFSG